MLPSAAPAIPYDGWIPLGVRHQERRAPRIVPPGDAQPRALVQWGYGHGPVVLGFLHGETCLSCWTLVEEWSRHSATYAAYETTLVAVVPQVPQRWAPGVWFIPDPKGAIRQQYETWLAPVPSPGVMVVILDPFASPWAIWTGSEPHPEAIHRGLVEWLTFIGLQCPE